MNQNAANKRFAIASKSRVLITTPAHAMGLRKQKLLQLMQSFGEISTLVDLAHCNEYCGLQGFVCDYFDIRAASNLVACLNGSIIDVRGWMYCSLANISGYAVHGFVLP